MFERCNILLVHPDHAGLGVAKRVLLVDHLQKVAGHDWTMRLCNGNFLCSKKSFLVCLMQVVSEVARLGLQPLDRETVRSPQPLWVPIWEFYRPEGIVMGEYMYKCCYSPIFATGCLLIILALSSQFQYSRRKLFQNSNLVIHCYHGPSWQQDAFMGRENWIMDEYQLHVSPVASSISLSASISSSLSS